MTAPSYRVVDASVRRTLTENLTMDIRASNLFDTAYFVSVSGAPPRSGRIGAPRTVEFTLTARF